MSSLLSVSCAGAVKAEIDVEPMADSNVSVVIKNAELDQTHYISDVDPSTHFHDLLITYCRNHYLDVKNFVFLIPHDVNSSRKISWKVATPSMRVLDYIFETNIGICLDPLFNMEGRRIYLQCVQKEDVPNFVAWNNCLSSKYSKTTKPNVEAGKSPQALSRNKVTPRLRCDSFFFLIGINFNFVFF